MHQKRLSPAAWRAGRARYFLGLTAWITAILFAFQSVAAAIDPASVSALGALILGARP